MAATQPVDIPASYGELFDKLTILEIKSERIRDAAKLVNIRNELAMLNKVVASALDPAVNIDDWRQQLKGINEKLWDIEDKIRIKEAASEFDEAFIQLARSVYFTNDRRSEIKREINLALGSNVIEEKSYADYQKPESS